MSNEKKIALLVEDSPIQAKAAKRVLLAMGFEVDETTTGEEAVEMSKKIDYDLGIFDIGLDGPMSGDQAVEKIRQQDAARNYPIFAVTAHVSDEAIRRYKDAGINEVFVKPIRKESIAKAYERFK